MIRVLFGVVLLLASQAGAIEEPDWVYDNSTGAISSPGTLFVNPTYLGTDSNHTIYAPAFLTGSEIIIQRHDSGQYLLFVGEDDVEVGRFTWADGVLHFEGRMDESAHELIRYINQRSPEFCEGVMKKEN